MVYTSKRFKKVFESLYKKLGITLLIAILVIVAVGSLTTLTMTVIPAVLNLSANTLLAKIITNTILGIVLSITINFVSKIYLFVHAELGTTFYGYITLLAGVIGSVVLIKVSAFITLITTIVVFMFLLVWEIEVLLSSKIETIYKKLSLENYRKHIVMKTLQLNLPTKILLKVLEKIDEFFKTGIINKLVDMIIKVEDSAINVVHKIEQILDKIISAVSKGIKLSKFLPLFKK